MNRANVSEMLRRITSKSVVRWLVPSASLCALCASSADSWATETNSWTAETNSWTAEPDTTVANEVAAADNGAFETSVPTVALEAARTHVKLNHWVKAAKFYLLASLHTPKDEGDITQLQAQREAEKEHAELVARIPRLTIELKGEDLETVQVFLDAEPFPNALLGANQLVDPGHHVVRAVRDGQSVTGELDVVERQNKTTTIDFARREPLGSHSTTSPSITTTFASTDPNASPPFLAATSSEDSALGISSLPAPAIRTELPAGFLGEGAVPTDSDSSSMRTLGWLGVGVGGVGLLVGTTAGLMARSARSKLLDSGYCHGSICSTNVSSDVERYERLSTSSTIGFVAGGLFAAAGATVLLLVPKKPRDTSAALVLAPATATVVGSF